MDLYGGIDGLLTQVTVDFLGSRDAREKLAAPEKCVNSPPKSNWSISVHSPQRASAATDRLGGEPSGSHSGSQLPPNQHAEERGEDRGSEVATRAASRSARPRRKETRRALRTGIAPRCSAGRSRRPLTARAAMVGFGRVASRRHPLRLQSAQRGQVAGVVVGGNRETESAVLLGGGTYGELDVSAKDHHAERSRAAGGDSQARGGV